MDSKELSAAPAVAFYKKGDFIDQEHEVCDVLGVGGFGVVYLVYAHGLYESPGVPASKPMLLALKTLRDEYLENEQTRERFRREANVWVDLERHPYLVRAHYIREIAGRLYIAMEYVAPDSEGLNSLRGHLERRPPDLAQSLRWAIQFCYGMEYAYAMGVRCHRDIKPDNILITSDHILKITDFGIAGILEASADELGIAPIAQNDQIGLLNLTMEGGSLGTPTHMSPEQFTDPAACDERSDIYSFGVVLYQMRTGGRCPFSPPLTKDDSKGEVARFWTAMCSLHTDAPVPRLNSRLFPVIQRCLEKDPRNRYRSFQELRSELERMLQLLTAEVIAAPELKDHEAWEWNNKAISLKELKRYDEAIQCWEKALEIDPRCAAFWKGKGTGLGNVRRFEEALACYSKAVEIDPRNADAWYNKGRALHSLGRYEEALACYSKALEIDPRCDSAWYNKGNVLHGLSRYEEALACYSKAVEIDPRCADAWFNKGRTLEGLGRPEEALACYSKAVEIDSRFAAAWFSKGRTLEGLGRPEEALACYSKALEIDPRCDSAWYNKGNVLHGLSRYEEALACYSKAVEIDPRCADAWFNKGRTLEGLGRPEEALACFSKALEIDPRDAHAWTNKGVSLAALGRHEEALGCYSKALEIDPRYTTAWNHQGVSLAALGRHEEALDCYSKALQIDPRYTTAWNNKGRKLYELGRHEEALDCYSKALQIDPHNAVAWNNKGVSLAALGRHEDVLACFSKALEIDPRDAHAWTNKGVSLAALGRHEEALDCYSKALQIDPRYTTAWNNKGRKLYELGRNKEAYACYSKALGMSTALALLFDKWEDHRKICKSCDSFSGTPCWDGKLIMDDISRQMKDEDTSQEPTEVKSFDKGLLAMASPFKPVNQQRMWMWHSSVTSLIKWLAAMFVAGLVLRAGANAIGSRQIANQVGKSMGYFDVVLIIVAFACGYTVCGWVRETKSASDELQQLIADFQTALAEFASKLDK